MSTESDNPGFADDDRGRALRRWVLQPLLDQGLQAEEIENLVLRVVMKSFAEEPGRLSPPAEFQALVTDQPAEVQTAWLEVVARIGALQRGGGPDSSRPL